MVSLTLLPLLSWPKVRLDVRASSEKSVTYLLVFLILRLVCVFLCRVHVVRVLTWLGVVRIRQESVLDIG